MQLQLLKHNFGCETQQSGKSSKAMLVLVNITYTCIYIQIQKDVTQKNKFIFSTYIYFHNYEHTKNNIDFRDWWYVWKNHYTFIIYEI